MDAVYAANGSDVLMAYTAFEISAQDVTRYIKGLACCRIEVLVGERNAWRCIHAQPTHMKVRVIDNFNRRAIAKNIVIGCIKCHSEPALCYNDCLMY